MFKLKDLLSLLFEKYICNEDREVQLLKTQSSQIHTENRHIFPGRKVFASQSIVSIPRICFTLLF